MSARAAKVEVATLSHDAIAMQQHLDDLNSICPCNNDPFGNGPCEDCREEIEQAKRRRAITMVR